MTIEQAYIQDTMARCRADFANHKATILVGPPLDDTRNAHLWVYNWKRPGTWIMGMRIIIHRRWLTFLGDVGESVYEWSEDIGPALLLGVDFGYFRGKCQASPHGRAFECFDRLLAHQALCAYARDLSDADGRARHAVESMARRFERGYISDEHEMHAAVFDAYNDGDLDAESASALCQCVMFPDCHQIAQFVGMQMALAQLYPELKEVKP